MGIVQRQSMKFVGIQYALIAVSILANFFLYTKNDDVYGVIRLFNDSALLIAGFVVLGTTSLVVRFFPKYNNTIETRSKLFSSGLWIIFIASIGFTLLYFILEDQIASRFVGKSKFIECEKYIWLLIPLVISTALQSYFKAFVSNYKRIAIPNAIVNSGRIITALGFFAYLSDYISVEVLMYIVVLNVVANVVMLFFYQMKMEKVPFSGWSKVRGLIQDKGFRTYGTYSILTAIGVSLAFKVDTVMLGNFTTTQTVGQFAIIATISSILFVPYGAVTSIANPIISSLMNEKAYGLVNMNYHKSTQVLLAFGMIFLGGTICTGQEILSLLSNGAEMLAAGGFAVLITTLIARLVEMATSLNSMILSHSEHYKLNLYLLLLLAVCNIALNIILIPKYGMVGCAIATMFSMVVFNLSKVGLLYWKYQLWPFDIKNLYVILITLGLAFCTNFLGNQFELQIIILILSKGLFFVILASAMIYFLQLAPELNRVADIALNKLRKKNT